MDKLSLFKAFVKKHPRLIKFVNEGDMTWQKFYEIYDLYGEEDSVWTSYISNNTVKEEAVTPAAATAIPSAAAGALGLGEMMSWLKNVDLDAVRGGIESIQRVIGVVQDFAPSKDSDTSVKEEYKPRPLYKNFED